MGFSNLGTICGIIGDIYQIDFEIQCQYQEKMSLATMSRVYTNEISMLSKGYADALGQARANGQVNADQSAMMQYNAEVEARRQVMANISQIERQIDQILEELKAKRTALQQQKQEFQQYVKENIQSTFKNNYMG